MLIFWFSGTPYTGRRSDRILYHLHISSQPTTGDVNQFLQAYVRRLWAQALEKTRYNTYRLEGWRERTAFQAITIARGGILMYSSCVCKAVILYFEEGSYLYTQHAGSGEIQQVTIHDNWGNSSSWLRENRPNFRDFIIDMFNERIVTWNWRTRRKSRGRLSNRWPSLLFNISFLFNSLTLLIFSSNLHRFLVRYVLNCQNFHNLSLSRDFSNIFKKSCSAIVIYVLLGSSYHDWIFCGVPQFLKGNSETVIYNRPQ